MATGQFSPLLPPLALDPELRWLARALSHDPDALHQVATWDPLRITAERLAPALALRAKRAGIDSPAVAVWRQVLRSQAALQLGQAEALSEMSAALARVNVDWLPLKGCDLQTRVYAQTEERPAADLDVLVRPQDLDRARTALQESGFSALRDSPRSEHYLRHEGYAWQARDGRGMLLELHFRLWGLVPEGLVAELFTSATPDPLLGPTGHRLTLAGAFVVAGVHLWMDPPPRPLLRFWDLERIASAAGPDLIPETLNLSQRWGLGLPLTLAAWFSGELWRDSPCGQLAAALLPGLRQAERRVVRNAARQLMTLPLSTIVLAQICARRPSRTGWRRLGRRLWAHPAQVEQATPASWSWPRRRATHLWATLRHLRLGLSGVKKKS